jgi:hypothetical protein
LILDIQNYCERSDEPFVNQIPRFIMMAENRIASESKPLGFLRTVTGQLNGNVLEKPARWRKTRSFALINGVNRWYLFERGYEFCRTYAYDPSFTGPPKYYADYDYEHFFVAPTPDLPYYFELQYYERPAPLSETNQTNWTTRYAPQLLLYATLMEAMPFLKTSERIPEFQGLYDRALGAISKEDTERTIDSSAIRT